MKPLDSAETGVKTLNDGLLELTIRHAILKAVTPAMLGWWFQNIEGTMEHLGQTYPRYLVWHPIDHIHYEVVRRVPDGTAGPGARFHLGPAPVTRRPRTHAAQEEPFTITDPLILRAGKSFR